MSLQSFHITSQVLHIWGVLPRNASGLTKDRSIFILKSELQTCKERQALPFKSKSCFTAHCCWFRIEIVLGHTAVDLETMSAGLLDISLESTEILLALRIRLARWSRNTKRESSTTTARIGSLILIFCSHVLRNDTLLSSRLSCLPCTSDLPLRTGPSRRLQMSTSWQWFLLMGALKSRIARFLKLEPGLNQGRLCLQVF